jgi:hypothetical protein
MDMKVSLESLYLKHFEHVGISIIYEKVNKIMSSPTFYFSTGNPHHTSISLSQRDDCSELAQCEHRVLGEAFREGAVNESALGPGGRSPNALVRDTLGIVTIARCKYLLQLFL